MAILIFSYGMLFDRDDTFFKNNQQLIEDIRARESNNGLDWTDKTISTVGGGNWDVSYFVGVPIKVFEYTENNFSEFENLKIQTNWEDVFNDRLKSYPALIEALKPYQSQIDYKIILEES